MGRNDKNKAALHNKAIAPPAIEGYNAVASMEPHVTARVDAELLAHVRADVLYKILSEPDLFPSYLKDIINISHRLVEQDGSWTKYEVDIKNKWAVWKFSGVWDNRMIFEMHKDNGTVSFRLREPGLLKTFEGTWFVKPATQEALHLLKSNAHAVPVAREASRITSAIASIRNSIVSIGKSFMKVASPTKRNAADLPSHEFVVDESTSSTTSACASPAGSSEPRTSVEDGDHEDMPMPLDSVVKFTGVRMSPKMAPPLLMRGALKGQLMHVVENMIKDLVAAAQKLQVEQDQHAAKAKAAPETVSAAQLPHAVA